MFATLIKMAREEGAAVLVATHNMNLTVHMDRVMTLDDGAVVEFDTSAPRKGLTGAEKAVDRLPACALEQKVHSLGSWSRKAGKGNMRARRPNPHD